MLLGGLNGKRIQKKRAVRIRKADSFAVQQRIPSSAMQLYFHKN